MNCNISLVRASVWPGRIGGLAVALGVGLVVTFGTSPLVIDTVTNQIIQTIDSGRLAYSTHNIAVGPDGSVYVAASSGRVYKVAHIPVTDTFTITVSDDHGGATSIPVTVVIR